MTRYQKAEEPLQNIERLLNSVEPELRKSFLEVVSTIQDSLLLSQLERLLESGDIETAFSIITSVAALLGSAYVDHFIASANQTASFIEQAVNRFRRAEPEIHGIGELVVGFDQTNESAVLAMRENRLRLIRGFTDSQRQLLAQVLTDGIQQGQNPREIARRFRSYIGLTARQAAAVDHYRRLLESGSAAALSRELRDRRFDRTVRRSVSGEAALTGEQIDRMVERYRQRSLALRAETIARTEALRSVHQGADAMYQQAFDTGVLQPGQVVYEWQTAADSRVRDPAHTAMHNQQRPAGEPFVSGLGNRLLYPGDPNAPGSETINCRCARPARLRPLSALPGFSFQIIDEVA